MKRPAALPCVAGLLLSLHGLTTARWRAREPSSVKAAAGRGDTNAYFVLFHQACTPSASLNAAFAACASASSTNGLGPLWTFRNERARSQSTFRVRKKTRHIRARHIELRFINQARVNLCSSPFLSYSRNRHGVMACSPMFANSRCGSKMLIARGKGALVANDPGCCRLVVARTVNMRSTSPHRRRAGWMCTWKGSRKLRHKLNSSVSFGSLLNNTASPSTIIIGRPAWFVSSLLCRGCFGNGRGSCPSHRGFTAWNRHIFYSQCGHVDCCSVLRLIRVKLLECSSNCPTAWFTNAVQRYNTGPKNWPRKRNIPSANSRWSRV